MKRDEALAILSAHKGELADWGVAPLALFGSVARDEAGPPSDVEVLVRFSGPATLGSYMGLLFALQEWLGRRVDLVTERSLAAKPAWAAKVATERLHVA